MSSVFSKIISGEIQAYKVAETEEFLAFLDINPLTKGHTLAIPKKEVDNLFDLDESTYIGLQLFTRFVAEALQKSLSPKRVGVAVVGFEVPHCHIHLIPINKMEEMNFQNQRLQLSSEEMEKIQARIQQYVPGITSSAR